MNKPRLEGETDNRQESLDELSSSSADVSATRIQQLETALEDLQSRFLFQEDTLMQLDDALVAQRNTIDRLEKMLSDFVDKVDQQLHERQGGAPEHERPPHY